MYNHARQDHGEHRTKAVMANFGWLAVMWGILVVIWSNVAMPYMPDLTNSPSLQSVSTSAHHRGRIIIVGILFIARDSALEMVEFPTIISHVLSYARMVAVGLSSVAIAMVINYIAIGMFISPALKELPIVGIDHDHRWCCDFPYRAYAQPGAGYSRWRTPLDSFALCRILHQVLQGWRQEVYSIWNETKIYGGLNYGRC